MKTIIRKWIKYLIALVLHYSGYNSHILSKANQYIVLMFHKLDDANDYIHLSVTGETFSTISLWCNDLGSITSLDDVLSTKYEDLHFCLTFDDGYADNSKIPEILPNIPVTVYLATGFIDDHRKFWAQYLQQSIVGTNASTLDLSAVNAGIVDVVDERQQLEAIKEVNRNIKEFSPEKITEIVDDIAEQCGNTEENHNGFMDWKEVNTISDAGVEIGSHTHDHFIVSSISDEEFRKQLNVSREYIEKNVKNYSDGKKKLQHFAFPNGRSCDISENATQVLKDAGFSSAVTTIEGINQFGDDHYKIKRFNMDETRLRSPFGGLSKALFTTMLANRIFYN